MIVLHVTLYVRTYDIMNRFRVASQLLTHLDGCLRECCVFVCVIFNVHRPGAYTHLIFSYLVHIIGADAFRRGCAGPARLRPEREGVRYHAVRGQRVVRGHVGRASRELLVPPHACVYVSMVPACACVVGVLVRGIPTSKVWFKVWFEVRVSRFEAVYPRASREFRSDS